jgi:hypothetical protein
MHRPAVVPSLTLRPSRMAPRFPSSQRLYGTLLNSVAYDPHLRLPVLAVRLVNLFLGRHAYMRLISDPASPPLHRVTEVSLQRRAASPKASERRRSLDGACVACVSDSSCNCLCFSLRQYILPLTSTPEMVLLPTSLDPTNPSQFVHIPFPFPPPPPPHLTVVHGTKIKEKRPPTTVQATYIGPTPPPVIPHPSIPVVVPKPLTFPNPTWRRYKLRFSLVNMSCYSIGTGGSSLYSQHGHNMFGDARR